MFDLSLGVFFPIDDFLLLHIAALENTLTILITAFGYFIFIASRLSDFQFLDYRCFTYLLINFGVFVS